MKLEIRLYSTYSNATNLGHCVSTNHYVLQFNAIKVNTLAAIFIFHTNTHFTTIKMIDLLFVPSVKD